MLTEIEAVVNSRPLTYLSADDLDEPLTPSHFLCGRRVLSLLDGLSEDMDEEFALTQIDLSRRLRHLNAMLNRLWRRWRAEYLLELRESHRRHGGRPDAVPPSVGDIVLVEDEDRPRGLWKLARVGSLITGRDGHPCTRCNSSCYLKWEQCDSATTPAAPVPVGGSSSLYGARTRAKPRRPRLCGDCGGDS